MRVSSKSTEKTTREVVINDCHGGFSLSFHGVMHYAKLKGMKIFGFQDDYADGRYNFNKQVPYNGTGKEPFCIHYSKTDQLEDGKIPEGEYFSDRDILRDDPFLVKTVRKLGKKANGQCAKLKIVKIPADVKWHVEEYDGAEWIAEDHRKWY